MRLINADTVVTIQVYNDMTEETDTKKMTIAEAIDEWSDEGCPPTEDAVSVVRCKDCKHCRPYNWKHLLCVEDKYGPRLVIETDFCSWGERKEECPK